MSTIARTRSPSNGFFGEVASGLGQAIGNFSSEILPIWAADQLDVQQSDQLSQPTFNRNVALPRNDDEQPTTSGPATTGAFNRTAVQGNFTVDTVTAVALVAVTIVAGIIVAKAV